MTPTGDFGASFITPHASVILPGLPRSARASERAGIVGYRRVWQYSRRGGYARRPMRESAGKGCHSAIPMPPKRRSNQWRPETHGDKSAKPRPPATPLMETPPMGTPLMGTPISRLAL